MKKIRQYVRRKTCLLNVNLYLKPMQIVVEISMQT